MLGISPELIRWLSFGALAAPFMLVAIRLFGHRISVDKWPLYVLVVGLCVIGGFVACGLTVLLSGIAVLKYFGAFD